MSKHDLSLLRQRLAASLKEPAAGSPAPLRDPVTLGAEAVDGALGGGIAPGSLHEVYARGARDAPAATAFTLALAVRAATQDRAILWVRQDAFDAETGAIYPPGLAELGLQPHRFILVKARDAEGVLRAGEEGARCPALGAVLIAPWGDPQRLDLTTTRRLTIAAARSGVTTLMLRVSPVASPSSALTRWRIESLPSRALAANAPGAPAFLAHLLRHRGGMAEQAWPLEWNRDRASFEDRTLKPATALPRPLVPVPDSRSAEADRAAYLGDKSAWRKAG